MSASSAEIILWHYHASPYGRRVRWYLILRGIAFSECLVDVILPRPELDALGVRYRRVPLLSIGRDVYCDSRLIIAKLEQLYPSGALGSSQPDHIAAERLLQRWITDGGVFWAAVGLMPMDSSWTQRSGSQDAFEADRTELLGASFRMKDLQKGRPKATARMKNAFELLETSFLADGRDWILKTDQLTLADLEAVWVFAWVMSLPGALDEEHISPKIYPKVFAWVKRFGDAVNAAKDKASRKRKTVSSEAANRAVTSANFAEPEPSVNSDDPLKLEKGDVVTLNPIDQASTRRDTGPIVALNDVEVVISVKSPQGADIHVHAPRWGFNISKTSSPNL